MTRRDPCETCTQPTSACEFCEDSRAAMVRALSGELQDPVRFARDYNLTNAEARALVGQTKGESHERKVGQ